MSAKSAPTSAAGGTIHPRRNDQNQPVVLLNPSQPTDVALWGNSHSLAQVVPDGPMPSALNGIAVAPWTAHPTTAQGWEDLVARHPVEEPALVAPAGFKRAAGTVIREPDGRVWLVAPTNAFGGYQATFPKGTIENLSAQATAIRETWEESGLHVRLLGHLIDVKRSQSFTRYYLAQRLGGHPGDMGWESQAVMLVPLSILAQKLNSVFDLPVLQAIQMQDPPRSRQ